MKHGQKFHNYERIFILSKFGRNSLFSMTVIVNDAYFPYNFRNRILSSISMSQIVQIGCSILVLYNILCFGTQFDDQTTIHDMLSIARYS